MTSLNDLYAIANRDPDNGEVEPKTNDLAVFDEWVIATYGKDTLHTYLHTNWRPASDV